MIESFNGRLRQDCLNQHWFQSIVEARRIIEGWRHDDTANHRHSALGYVSPQAGAVQWRATTFGSLEESWEGGVGHVARTGYHSNWYRNWIKRNLAGAFARGTACLVAQPTDHPTHGATERSAEHPNRKSQHHAQAADSIQHGPQHTVHQPAPQ